VEVMREAAARVLALEAGRTLLLDKDRFLAQAESAGIAVWGMEEDG
jgi:UDP-2,3-diacylglucosamine hydrolase